MAGASRRLGQAVSQAGANALMTSIIVNLNFNFKRKLVRPALPRSATIAYMPEALDIVCPCCEALLKIDPETRSVVWADKKKAPARDFDELVNRVRSQKSVLDEKFQRSVEQTKHSREILDKKFEEAKRRAADDPAGRPPHPFDNE